MSCPDWRALSPDLSADAGTAAWNDAVRHFDGGCLHCRRDALRADPTLVFRSLRSAPAVSSSVGSSEAEAMCQAVAAMRAASRVDSSETRSRRRFLQMRWVAAAGLTLAALSIPGDNAWKYREQKPGVAGERRPAVHLGAVVPAALGEADLPTVEGVNRPGARVYNMDGEGLSVVMIVDESFDV